MEIYENCGSYYAFDPEFDVHLAVARWDQDGEPAWFEFSAHSAYNFSTRKEAERELKYHLNDIGIPEEPIHHV